MAGKTRKQSQQREAQTGGNDKKRGRRLWSESVTPPTLHRSYIDKAIRLAPCRARDGCRVSSTGRSGRAAPHSIKPLVTSRNAPLG